MTDSQHHRRLAVHSIVTLGTTVGVVLLRFVRNAIVARLLGPGLRGVFDFLALIPDIVVSFADLGFGPATIYYVAKEKYDLRRVMGGVLLFATFVGGASVVATEVMLRIGTYTLEQQQVIDAYRPLLLGGALLLMFMNLGTSFIMARGMIYSLNVISVIGIVIPLGLFLFLYFLRPDAALDAAFWSWFAGLAAITLLPFVLLRRHGAYPPKIDASFIGRAVRYGLAGHFSNFFQKALRRMDFFFVAAYCDPVSLGYYTTATALSEMMLMVPESVAVPFIPIVFGMDKGNSDRFTPLVVKTIFAFMVLTSIPVVLFGHWFIVLVFGADYGPCYSPLALLLPGMIGLGIYPVLKADLFGRNRPGTVSSLVSISLVANFVLNWLTIPRWGIQGAAVSSSISYLLSMFLLYMLYCRLSGNHPVRSLLWSRAELAAIGRFVLRKLRRD